MRDRFIWLLGTGLCLSWLALAGTFDGWMRAAGFVKELRPYVQGLLPALAALIVTCFGGRAGWLKASLLIGVIAIASTISNFISGELGGRTDFPGIAGALPFFSMMIVIATAMIAPGVLLGLIAKHIMLRRARPSNETNDPTR